MIRLLLPWLALSLVAAKPAPPPAPEPAPAPAPADPLGPMPEMAAPRPWAPVAAQAGKLANGASLWVVADPGLPLVTVDVTVHGGSALDPAGKAGTASLSDQLMAQGAGKLDAEAFAALVERNAIQVDIATGRDRSTIRMSMHKDRLDTALGLLADMILRPRYKKKDFALEQSLQVAYAEQGLSDPATVAANVAWWHWFGGGRHPYARPPEGTPGGLAAVERADVRAYHQRAWVASGARVTVSGDVAYDDVRARLDRALGDWKAGAPASIDVSPPEAPDAKTLIVVDRPGSAQTAFYVMFPGHTFGAPETAPMRIGAVALGGTFTARLNHLLREVRGYTYGVRAADVALPRTGALVISTRIRTDATVPALADLLGELERLPQGLTDAELGKAKGAFRQDLVEAVETTEGRAATYAPYHVAGLGPDALPADLAATAAVDLAAANAALSAWSPDKAQLVLVGDLAGIRGGLEHAGFTLKVVPADVGRPAP